MLLEWIAAQGHSHKIFGRRSAMDRIFVPIHSNELLILLCPGTQRKVHIPVVTAMHFWQENRFDKNRERSRVETNSFFKRWPKLAAMDNSGREKEHTNCDFEQRMI
jgi:hypothetical protein